MPDRETERYSVAFGATDNNMVTRRQHSSQAGKANLLSPLSIRPKLGSCMSAADGAGIGMARKLHLKNLTVGMNF